MINKLSVTNGGNVDETITVPSTATIIQVALWWPESTTLHNDIDLYFLNSSGTPVTQSTGTSGIWEKIGYNVSGGNLRD